MEMKVCTKCGKTLPIGRFVWVEQVEMCGECAKKVEPERMAAAQNAKPNEIGTYTVKPQRFSGKYGKAGIQVEEGGHEDD